MKYIAYAVFSALIIPSFAFAALDVTFNADTSYVVNSIDLTVKSGSVVDYITVNNGSNPSLDVKLSAGASITITSEGKTLTVSPTTAYNNGTTCTNTSSSIALAGPSTMQGTAVIKITPSSAACTGASGGSGSGGGGGLIRSSGSGGGGSTVSTAATPAAQEAPKSSTTPTATAVSVVNAVISKNLNQGAKGPDVTKLQQLLANEKTIYPEGTVSGYYGAATTKAVKAFQKKYGINPITGTVGPLTRAKIQEVYGGTQKSAAPETPASSQAQTDVVKIKALQDQLKALMDQLNTLKKK